MTISLSGEINHTLNGVPQPTREVFSHPVGEQVTFVWASVSECTLRPEAAEYGRYHHDYPATDIFAPIGTAFVAVPDGVIDELRHEDPRDPATNLGGDWAISRVGVSPYDYLQAWTRGEDLTPVLREG